MKRKRIIAFLAVAGLAALLLVAGDARARATRTTFTGEQISFTPTGPPDKQWFTGTAPIMHIRGLVNHNFFEADDSRMHGECYVTLDINLNLATGHGTFHAKAVFYPEGIDGTWECSGSGTFTGGLGSGLLVGHGTGALEGQVLHWWLVDDVYTSGWILDPSGEWE